LYLLKIEPPPRELWWTLTIFFILLSTLPLAHRWAVGRALHHPQPRFFLFRWLAGLAAVPVVAFTYSLSFFRNILLTWPGEHSGTARFFSAVPFLAL